MRSKKGLRTLGLVVAAVFAIGIVGYVAGQGGDDASEFPTSGGSAGSFGDKDMVRDDFGGQAAPPVGVASDGDASEEARNSAPAAGAPESAPGGAGAALASSIDRKIVSTASIQMQVENVGGSFEEVGRIATAAGGFVASSSFSNRGDDQVASVTIRVPAESYQSVLGSLRNLGVKVDAESSDANDVTEQYTDLGSRLRTLEATESQLLTLLERAETISDILTVQDRLNYTRGEIEQVKGRMQLLDDLTSLATITVHLQPVVAGNGGGPSEGVDLGAEVAEAWDASMEFLGEVAAGVVRVVVFAWWVPVAGVPLLLVYKAMTRNRPQAVD